MEQIYTDRNSLHVQGKKLAGINYRPNIYIVITVLFGIFLIVLTRQIVGILAGLFCIGTGLFFFLKVKDRPVLDIYDKCIVFYDPEDSSKAFCTANEDIREFQVQSENSSLINFRLSDDTVYTVRTLKSAKAYTVLAKALPGKGTDDKNLSRKWR